MSVGCSRCSGSGWDPVVDDECACVARDEHQSSAEEPRQLLTEAEQDQLASRVRWILRDSGKAGRIAPAAIARAVASGALPSSVEQLAAYCHVDLEVAGRVMTVIREVRRG